MLPFKEIIRVGGSLILRNGDSTCRRNYGKIRSVVPVDTRMRKIHPKQAESEERKEVRQLKSKFRKDLREEMMSMNTGGDPMEPALDQLDSALTTTAEDYERLDTKLRRDKAFRKHFRPYVEKEVSVLTWAEKENIRFLHNSNPEEWTIEALASAFPISPDGVEKVLKSTFRARSISQIQSHDQNVADRIKQIRSGEIPMTPELERKMEMRDQIPIKVGAFCPNDDKLMISSSLPKVIGEFARLVTPVTKQMVNAKSENIQLAAAISSNKNPDIGDSYMVSERNSKELRSLGVSPREPMTLQEFKSNMKSNDSRKDSPKLSDSTHRELEYFKTQREIEAVKPTSISEVNISHDSMRQPEYEDYLNYTAIPKYKPSIQRELEIAAEEEESKNESSISQKTNTFQQESFRSKDMDEDPDWIEIPPEFKKPGSLFKRGQSYYDENGSFLYRVV